MEQCLYAVMLESANECAYAVAEHVSDDYKQQTKDAVEGAGIFPLIGSDKYILMYDVYMKGKYQFTESADLEHFKVIDHAISMDFHPRHGTVIPITQKELQRLFKAYGKPEGF